MRGLLGRGERVGQAAQQRPVGVEQVQHAAVEADGDAPAGEVVADGVLPAGEADQAGGVDETVDLDGSPWRDRAGGDRRRAGVAAAVGEEVAQVGGGEPGGHGLKPDAVDEQVNHGGVGPDADGESGSGWTEPELLPADGKVSRGGNSAGDLDGQVDRVGAPSAAKTNGAAAVAVGCWSCDRGFGSMTGGVSSGLARGVVSVGGSRSGSCGSAGRSVKRSAGNAIARD